MTSSLCAALSLVFGAASHDEFVHNGHPDLVINSRKLMALRDRELQSGESPLFVAEAKRVFPAEANRGSKAATATGAWTQLTNYLTRSAKHGALIFYIEEDDFEATQAALLSALASHRACVPGQKFNAAERLNVLTFRDPRYHRHLEIAIVGIRHAAVGTQSAEADALNAAFAAADNVDSESGLGPDLHA